MAFEVLIYKFTQIDFLHLIQQQGDIIDAFVSNELGYGGLTGRGVLLDFIIVYSSALFQRTMS